MADAIETIPHPLVGELVSVKMGARVIGPVRLHEVRRSLDGKRFQLWALTKDERAVKFSERLLAIDSVDAISLASDPRRL